MKKVLAILGSFLKFGYAHAAPIIFIGSFAFIMLLLHTKAYDYLVNTSEFNINMGAMKLEAQPDWASAWYNSTIEIPAPTEDEICIFDADLAGNVAKYYESNPWVERVNSVEKVFPNRLKVSLELRRPVVAVEKNGWYYLTDAKEYRLPGRYAPEEIGAIGLPSIIRTAEALPEPGQRWTGESVKAAIAVVESLKAQGIDQAIRISAVDMENFGGRMNPLQSEIVIWAEDSVPIMWGRSPYSEKFGETPVEKKLENLKAVLEARPRLQGLKTVKIQFDRPYVVQR